MKKIFTELMFIISCIVDVYAFVLLCKDNEPSEIFFISAFFINLVTICLLITVVKKLYILKKIGNISVEGIDLTVISQKNLTRKKMKTLEADTVEYSYDFSDNGFEANMRFRGKVVKRFGKVSGINLNFSGDSNQMFEEIDAYAYDLITDESKKTKIAGVLSKNNGLNKNVYFKFQHPLKYKERFDYCFHYKWNNCVNPEKDYIAAIPPFKKINPNQLLLNVSFDNKIVTTFNAYSFQKYKLKKEEVSSFSQNNSVQQYTHKYILDENFNFAIAVFTFQK